VSRWPQRSSPTGPWWDLAPHVDRPKRPASLLEPLRWCSRIRACEKMAFASCTYSGMQACLSTFLVVYLTQRVGFSVPVAGAVLATAMTAGIIGRISWELWRTTG